MFSDRAELDWYKQTARSLYVYSCQTLDESSLYCMFFADDTNLVHNDQELEGTPIHVYLTIFLLPFYILCKTRTRQILIQKTDV